VKNPVRIELSEYFPELPFEFGETKGKLFSSREWFELGALSGRAEIRFLIARKNGGISAVLPFLASAPRAGGSYDHVSKVLKPALGTLWKSTDWEPAITVGSWNSGVSVPISSGPFETDSYDVVRALLNGVSEIQGGAAQSLIWPFLDVMTARNLAIALGQKSVVFRYGTTAWLDTNCEHFDEYLRRFNSHRRRTILSELRRFAQSGGYVSVHPIGDVLDQIVAILAESKSNQGGLAEVDAIKHILTMQSRVFSDRALAFCGYRDGVLHSVATAIEYNGTLYGRSFGRRLDEQEIPFEYFVLCYYGPLRYCIERGLKTLHLGGQANVPKKQRGSEIQGLATLSLSKIAISSEIRQSVDQWNHRIDRPGFLESPTLAERNND
jgi:hypothetical protein